MYFVDKIQAQGTRQRKIPVPKKFWDKLPIGSIVKVELVDNPSLFFVNKVQLQGKVQRRIPLPKRFWEEFPVGSFVTIKLLRSGSSEKFAEQEIRRKGSFEKEEKIFSKMYFVDKVQAQGSRQRKVSLSKKFWKEFPLGSMVKISLIDDLSLFYVDKVQEQGKLQRRIPLPQKFWEEFPVGTLVKVEVINSKINGR